MPLIRFSQGGGIDTRASHMSASDPLGADSDRATRSHAPRPVAPYIADLEGDGADVRNLMRLSGFRIDHGARP